MFSRTVGLFTFMTSLAAVLALNPVVSIFVGALILLTFVLGLAMVLGLLRFPTN